MILNFSRDFFLNLSNREIFLSVDKLKHLSNSEKIPYHVFSEQRLIEKKYCNVDCIYNVPVCVNINHIRSSALTGSVVAQKIQNQDHGNRYF